MIQSNCSICAIAASSGAKSSGSAKATSGSITGMAPRAESSLPIASLCAAARVITIRLPTSEFEAVSATLPAHFFQDGLRARFNEHLRYVFAQLRRLIWMRNGALLYILRAIHGAYASVEDKFATLDPRPRAQRHLATPMQRGQECALRNDRRAGLCIIQRREKVCRVRVLQPAFHGDGPLSHGGDTNILRENLRKPPAPAPAVQDRFCEHHPLAFSPLHLSHFPVP